VSAPARVAALDLGSSSLKTAAYAVGGANELEVLQCRNVPFDRDDPHASEQALTLIANDVGDAPLGIGHRIVFGGPDHFEPVLASDAILRELATFDDIEPLHLHAQLDLCRAARMHFPDARHVLCFDTAFHRRAPAIAHALPLPRNLDPLMHRYGFHGLSYEYIAEHLPERGRAIVAHLGSGASLCAMRDRAPVDTTMGLSALGGLMMATRPGDLDPGVMLHLIDRGYDASSLRTLLSHQSGLLGVSESSDDMRALLDVYATDERAALAVDLFVYQLVKMLGAMIAVLGGVDTIVFTGGIGEHAPVVRARACASFAFLGLTLDDARNGRDDRVISGPASTPRVEVIPTNENLMIARHALRLTDAR